MATVVVMAVVVPPAVAPVFAAVAVTPAVAAPMTVAVIVAMMVATMAPVIMAAPVLHGGREFRGRGRAERRGGLGGRRTDEAAGEREGDQEGPGAARRTDA